ncbi:MAG: amino acid ABC transporter substrate-binding protein [Gammaproteobacteria bacterium]|nr:amino acid ABC transporter substrate-binding protein [Gammaproteobacteria bacterium]
MTRLAFSVRFALLLLTVLITADAVAASSSVRVIVYAKPFQQGDSHQMYQVKLLSAALDKVGIAHLLVPSQTPMLQERALRTIAGNDGVDVFWSLTTLDREQHLRPVRFPIDKGLYGWRLLLVKPGHSSMKIQRLADLQTWVLTQGHDWPDTPILLRNALQVVTSNNFASMVELVKIGRVAAFPRSAIEIWSEIDQQNLALTVEPGVALHYPIALYYFFSKEQEQLAQQVELGLELLRESGEFEAMFQAEFGESLRRSALAQRRVIELTNPLLPKLTPLDRPELWYQPKASTPLPADVIELNAQP